METSGEDETLAQRVVIPAEEAPTKEQMMVLWAEQDRYIDHLETRVKKTGRLSADSPAGAGGAAVETEAESASKREHLLVVRLATKEQELQELSNQISELKAAQSPSTAAMRNALLDPAVNIIVQKLKQELDATKAKLAQTNEEMSAWKFTPDSVTGKRLMARCRQLLLENEEIGKMVSSGRLAKLEGELAMQKRLVEEMKKNQLETDDFVQELDEDMEGMQSTIYFLQQQLKEAKDTIAKLETKLQEEAAAAAEAATAAAAAAAAAVSSKTPSPPPTAAQREDEPLAAAAETAASMKGRKRTPSKTAAAASSESSGASPAGAGGGGTTRRGRSAKGSTAAAPVTIKFTEQADGEESGGGSRRKRRRGAKDAE